MVTLQLRATGAAFATLALTTFIICRNEGMAGEGAGQDLQRRQHAFDQSITCCLQVSFFGVQHAFCIESCFVLVEDRRADHHPANHRPHVVQLAIQHDISIWAEDVAALTDLSVHRSVETFHHVHPKPNRLLFS